MKWREPEHNAIAFAMHIDAMNDGEIVQEIGVRDHHTTRVARRPGCVLQHGQ